MNLFLVTNNLRLVTKTLYLAKNLKLWQYFLSEEKKNGAF